MSQTPLFQQSLSDSLRIELDRDDRSPTVVSWHTSLINNLNRVVVDSYSERRIPMRLGDAQRMASGEDLVFHHNLAGALLLDRSVFAVRNRQGQVSLVRYSSADGLHFECREAPLFSYRAVGALGRGFQYADFLAAGEDLYILVAAGCEMGSRESQPDYLFRYDLRSGTVSSLNAPGGQLVEQSLETASNPFEALDVRDGAIAGRLRQELAGALRQMQLPDGGGRLRLLGVLENIDSRHMFDRTPHRRYAGMLYFIFDAGRGRQIASFEAGAPVNRWRLIPPPGLD